jgi:hypothetical protein
MGGAQVHHPTTCALADQLPKVKLEWLFANLAEGRVSGAGWRRYAP